MSTVQRLKLYYTSLLYHLHSSFCAARPSTETCLDSQVKCLSLSLQFRLRFSLGLVVPFGLGEANSNKSSRLMGRRVDSSYVVVCLHR